MPMERSGIINCGAGASLIIAVILHLLDASKALALIQRLVSFLLLLVWWRYSIHAPYQKVGSVMAICIGIIGTAILIIICLEVGYRAA
jgi:hypothetical protein